MSRLSDSDIVNSATPLETRFAGVHPRLYATGAELDALRGRFAAEPWSGFLRRVRAQADAAIRSGVPAPGPTGDDLRPVGCGLAHLAAAYRYTGERAYLAAARDHIARMAEHPDWTCSLQYGHWAHGMGLAYDWLFHELDAPLRQRAAETLRDRTERVFRHWGEYRDAYATGYAWNHSGVVHGGLVAAACAIHGEIDGVGRFLRMGLEKLRLMVDALGPDGSSAEGLAYGLYQADFQLKSMVLADRLLGLDFFSECAFYRRTPLFLLYSMLPRPGWSRQSTFLQLGDTNGCHWHGPDVFLRLIARRYRDGHAQWLADATAAAGVCADSSCFLNVLWHDETVAPQPPDDLPPMRWFDDKGIVMARGGWGDDASVLAFKCGPASGHHAARRYKQNVSGGHMHPDAGHVVLHACGDWLLVDDGYTLKQTAYQNTVLVNGVGQTGEGSTWFEDLEIRRGKAEGRILRAESADGLDWAIADVAPAYEPAARLRRFLRHLIYVRPDVWVLVDELEAEVDSTFELRFHAPAPFLPAEGGAWDMRVKTGALRLWSPGPTPCVGRPFRDLLKGTSPVHRGGELDALSVTNAAPLRSACFVTILHAHPAGAPVDLTVRLEPAGAGLRLTLARPRRTVCLHLHPGQPDPAQPIHAR